MIMDEAGSPKYKMRAVHLEHFPDDNSIDVKQPFVEYFRPQLSPWILVADEGQIFNKGNLIILNGKVVMERVKSKSEPYLKLVTRDLTIRTDTEYAETDAKVHIKTENHDLHATGMRVYLAQGKLELKKNVTGKYEVK